MTDPAGPAGSAASAARSEPVVLGTPAALREWRSGQLGSVGFVPTMGALHAGHGSLIERARRENDLVVVSIFVNPLQFDDAADLEAYPRTLESDLERCRTLRVDAVFAPSAAALYPRAPEVTVHGGRLGTVLEGASRPGHFDGMLTVVAKLLHLVAPERAYFGQKDAQQLALVRAMVADLDLPVTIVAGATLRDDDGLALSSRNSRLDAHWRAQARAIPRAVWAAAQASADGADAARAAAVRVLEESALRVDYVELVAPETFEPLDPGAAQGLLLIAAWAGEVRLIDNQLLTFTTAGPDGARPQGLGEV